MEEVYYKCVNNSEKIEMTKEEVSEMLKKREEFESGQWLMNRQSQYGGFAEQLDMIWHDLENGKFDKTGSWFQACLAVKERFPKEKVI